MTARTAAADAKERVLIVDDEPDIHRDFEDMLTAKAGTASDDLASAFVMEERSDLRLDFELLHAMSGDEAVSMISTERRLHRPISVAYIDIRMPPGMDGVEAVRRIRAIDREIEIVIMTAYTDKPLPEIVHDMELLHKLLYIRKPFAREEVQQITLALAQKWSVEQELARQRREITVSHRRLAAVLDAIGEAVAMYDDRSRLLFANRWYEEIMGTGQATLQEMAPDALVRLFKQRVRRPRAAQDAMPVEKWAGPGDIVEHVAEDEEGNRLLYRSRKPVFDAGGDAMGELYVYRDVSTEVEIERMREELTRLRSELETTYSFAEMVGDSRAMRRVYALMRRAMDSDVTVLITGESGTGKELVARALHSGGPRKERPFVAVNCAAIPPGLIESELFGHEQGAFTGAVRRRVGSFERAHGGTILFDEIGDMPYELQAKLLRVLQEREVERVGGTTAVAIDVRVIASTNRDLTAAIEAGEFRSDLYYRLATFPIALPPLREHREDVPLLASHFLKKSAERHAKIVTGISAGALRVLTRHGWPGNVRELQGAVERAVLVESTETLQSGSLPASVAAVGSVTASEDEQVLPLAELEEHAIRRALEATDNNVSKAAQILGISRATLHRKLRKHGAPAD